jgi:beta-phosphoglucomutase
MILKDKPIAALFDLDGVILDTESNYTLFWNNVMAKYKGDAELAANVKGQTLDRIYEIWFSGMDNVKKEITAALDKFETEMEMEYIRGFTDFVRDLKAHNVRLAIVTSSNKNKMSVVYRQHPELSTIFDYILTAEMFTHSKPAPDCYLLGAEKCKTVPDNCFVFEDSFSGLKAGRAADMHVIGLATTNPPEAIRDLADIVIPDFTGITCDRLLSGF